VSPVKYELGFYIPEDDILHSHCLENLKSYIDPVGHNQKLDLLWAVFQTGHECEWNSCV
jgi:hypothetical protein